jgi:esterase/lipase
MEMRHQRIGNIPVIIWGKESDRAYIYVHGKDSQKEHARKLAEEVDKKGCQVISFDLPGHGERVREKEQFTVQNCMPELKVIHDFAKESWTEISLYASSIGAYFSLVAYESIEFERCLFESPILNLERLIENMMGWFSVTEEDLETQVEIETPIGETLSWPYLQYVREHRISGWKTKTRILYGEKDNLTERHIIDDFIARFGGMLTVVEDGEHYLHSPEEVRELDNWLRNSCN